MITQSRVLKQISSYRLIPGMNARPTLAMCLMFVLPILAGYPVLAQPPETGSGGVEESRRSILPTTNSKTGEKPDASESVDAADPEEPKISTEDVIAEFKSLATGDDLEYGLEKIAAFDKASASLTETLIKMRQQHTLIFNGYTDERGDYIRFRNEAREAIQDTYRAALDLVIVMPHPDAVRFVMTEVESRRKHDVYDNATFEGSAKMMDLGIPMLYVAQATARSAMMTGKFEVAKRIYEKLSDDEVEEIDKALMAQYDKIKEQFEIEKTLLENDPEDLPKVRFRTTRGDFVVQLFINEAPSTVSHFIQLVESGFYDGCDFFQVVDGLLALTGDPLGDGSTEPEKFLKDEHGKPSVRMPLAGSLVMAKLPIPETPRFVPNSAGTQFAILYRHVPNVTEQQTVFGRVTEGMKVVGALRRMDPRKEKKKGEIKIPPDRILEAEVINRPEQLPEVIYASAPG
ncbi:MAG: peptidylprolyl isomerase [Planctomycetota bacterium]